MADIINYKNLPRLSWCKNKNMGTSKNWQSAFWRANQQSSCIAQVHSGCSEVPIVGAFRDAHFSLWSPDVYASAERVGETLQKIDPNQDGTLTKSEFVRYFPRLDWNILYANYSNFYQALQKWSSVCMKAPASEPHLLGRLQSLIKSTVALADFAPFLKPVDRTLPLNSAIWHSVASLWNMTITCTSDHGHQFVDISFSRLHPIKEYKIERGIGYSINNKNIVVTISHFSGHVTVLKGNLCKPRTLQFTLNPTGASISIIRRWYVEPVPD